MEGLFFPKVELPGYVMLSLMNLIVLSSTLLSSGCLAAGWVDLDVPHCDPGEVDSLLTMIMKQHPEILPPYLVPSKNWDKNVVTAFSIGLALGKQSNILKYMHSNSSTQQDKNCSSNNSSADCLNSDVGKLRYAFKRDKSAHLKVDMKNFQSVISANLKWRDGSKTYNPFDGLFDIDEIQKPEHYKNEAFLFPGEVRLLFAKHAKCPTAMIAIYVAILKFLVHAINTRLHKDHLIVVDGDLFTPICALSMHLQVRDYCYKDILIVLSQVQLFSALPGRNYLYTKSYTAPLINLFKLLDDGPIRTEIEEIITEKIKETTEFPHLAHSTMLLGVDHPFIKAMEKKLSHLDVALTRPLLQRQMSFKRKIHSMGNIDSLFYFSGIFTYFPYYEVVTAVIESNDALKWNERKKPMLENKFKFHNAMDQNRPEQRRLFIISQLPVPKDFWENLVSCTTLPQFLKSLENQPTRLMLLTYGIIILETSSKVEY